ncbi:MAG: hypothetical protein JG766_77 [Desulfacinum sp.]|jgi:hypothetical protein|nr:hypothetical protein [Desulfacinum sp.]
MSKHAPNGGSDHLEDHLPGELPGLRVLVVAHPDDEALWFSSVLSRVDRVIICFAQDRVVSDGASGAQSPFPLPHADFLDVPGFSGYHPIHFRYPLITRYGLAVYRSMRAARRYGRNARRLFQLLGERIPAGCHVFTHNPWGEYGHEEHVQVSRVLGRLAHGKKWTLWFSNYTSNKTWKLAAKYVFRQRVRFLELPVHQDLALRLKEYYEAHGIWTWHADWKWFSRECFWTPLESPLENFGHTVPLNLFKISY